MTEESKAELIQLENEFRRKAELSKNKMDINLTLANMLSDYLKANE